MEGYFNNTGFSGPDLNMSSIVDLESLMKMTIRSPVVHINALNVKFLRNQRVDSEMGIYEDTMFKENTSDRDDQGSVITLNMAKQSSMYLKPVTIDLQADLIK